MNRILLSLLLLMLLGEVGFSQSKRNTHSAVPFKRPGGRIQYASSKTGYFRVRPHGKGDSGLDLYAGVSHYRGNIFSAGYTYFFSDGLYVKADVYHATDHYSFLTHTSTGGDVSLALTLLNFHNLVFLNAVGGGSVSGDKFPSSLERGDMKNIPTQTKFGIFGGGEIEVVLDPRVSLLLNANERMYFGGKKEYNEIIFGTHRWYAMVGLRLHLFSGANQNPSNASKFR